MDTVAIVLYSLVGSLIYGMGYITCVTFLPKLHKIKEIEFSLKPFKIRFIFK